MAKLLKKMSKLGLNFNFVLILPRLPMTLNFYIVESSPEIEMKNRVNSQNSLKLVQNSTINSWNLCWVANINFFRVNVTTINKLNLNHVIWNMIVIISIFFITPYITEACVRYPHNALVRYWVPHTGAILI